MKKSEEKSVKRKLNIIRFYNSAFAEAYYQKLSAEGLHLCDRKGFGVFSYYEQGEPCEYQYRFIVNHPSERAAYHYYIQDEWERVFKNEEYYIFRKHGEDTSDINSYMGKFNASLIYKKNIQFLILGIVISLGCACLAVNSFDALDFFNLIYCVFIFISSSVFCILCCIGLKKIKARMKTGNVEISNIRAYERALVVYSAVPIVLRLSVIFYIISFIADIIMSFIR